MLKTLLKKEASRFLAVLSGINGSKKRTPFNNKLNKKSNPNKKKSGAAILILWAFILVSVGFAFSGIAHALADVLVPAGLDWLYYSIMGIMAFALSLIGNAFTASSVLFKAKDNELLLSMPINPRDILLSRTLFIYLLCVLFSLVVLIPAMLVRFIIAGFDLLQLINGLLIALFMGLLTTALSALLGWLLAFLSKHIKNKSIATAAFTFIFLGGYYYVQFNIKKYLQILVEASDSIGETINGNIFAWPVFQMGKAASGEVSALIYYAVFCIAVFVIVYAILSRNFIKIVTATEKTVSVKYEASKQADVQLQSPKKALIKREIKRFLASPVYMTNVLMGGILLIGLSVFLLIKKQDLLEKADMLAATVPILTNNLPLLVLAITFMLSGTVCTTAPSISLEGKTLWILKTMPVKTIDILSAKLLFGIIVAFPSAVIFITAASYVFGFDFSLAVFLIMAAYIFVSFNCLIGLILDLKHPKLDWTNEAQPVKQNITVLICFFSGIIVNGVLAALFFLFKDKLETMQLITGIILILGLAVRFLNNYVKKKGVECWDNLQV